MSWRLWEKYMLIIVQDEQRAEDAVNGWKWKVVVEEMDEYLRQQIKYHDAPGVVKDAQLSARDALRGFLDARNLSLW